MRSPRLFLPSLALLLALLPAGVGAATFVPLTPEQIAQIAAAIPAKATAVPAKPRRLLVFYRTEGFVHDSIPFGVEAFKEMGEKTGAYTAEASDDMAVFDPAKLNTFDAVLFLSTTGLKFVDPAQRQALLDFVKGGKGVIGIHAATDNFPTWPEGQELIGGHFKSHPWGGGDTEAVKVDDPASPITAAFAGKGFWIKDEIYQIVGPYDRAKQHVLLSLDMSKAQNQRDPSKIVRTDNDFPIAWIKTTPEGGRVFYSSLGHNKNIYATPQILRHYLDGIQFALGDLKADATPSASLSPAPAAAGADDSAAILNTVETPPSPAGPKPVSDGQPPKPAASALPVSGSLVPVGTQYEPSIPFKAGSATVAPVEVTPGKNAAPAPSYADALKAVPSYDWGQDRANLVAVEQQARAQKTAIEKDILGILSNPASTDPARQFAVRQLLVAGGKDSVPVLVKLLNDPKLGVLAATSLIGLADPSLDAAITDVFNASTGAVRLQLANVLGRRHAAGAIAGLAKLAASDDADEATAGLVSLGDLGTPDALQALNKAKVGKAFRALRERSRVYAAQAILDSGATGDAFAAAHTAFRDVLDGSAPRPIRIAALRGLIADDGAKAIPVFASALADSDPRFRADAAWMAAGFPDSDAVVAGLGDKLAALDPATQAVLLETLSAKPGPGIKAVLEKDLKSANPALVIAALRGLRTAGDAQTVPLLLPFLSQDNDAGKEALVTLSRCGGAAARPAIRAAFASAQGTAKAALLQVLADRADHDSFANIVAAANDPDKAVRAAAFQALATLAGPNDLATVLGLKPQSDGEKRFYGRTVTAAALATANRDQAADSLVAAFKATTDADLQQELRGALATLGSPKAFAFLQDQLKSSQEDDRRAAIKALAGSKNLDAMPVLLDTAAKAPTPTEKILALRGYLDLLTVPAHRSREQAFAAYQAAWPLADQQQDKDAILAAIGRIDLPAAKDFVQKNKQGA